jgi:uncharacterized protein YbcV (DUF1398 family)
MYKKKKYNSPKKEKTISIDILYTGKKLDYFFFVHRKKRKGFVYNTNYRQTRKKEIIKKNKHLISLFSFIIIT